MASGPFQPTPFPTVSPTGVNSSTSIPASPMNSSFHSNGRGGGRIFSCGGHSGGRGYGDGHGGRLIGILLSTGTSLSKCIRVGPSPISPNRIWLVCVVKVSQGRENAECDCCYIGMGLVFVGVWGIWKQNWRPENLSLFLGEHGSHFVLSLSHFSVFTVSFDNKHLS